MATAKKAASSAKSAAVALQSETSTAVTVSVPKAISAALPAGFKVKRVITVPSLALKEVGIGRALLFVDAMRVSKVEDKSDKKREPATVATVTDVGTGEQFIFIVPAVVKANLVRDYPDDSYVGKAFYIQNLGKRNESQRYNDFGIAEVEPDVAE